MYNLCKRRALNDSEPIEFIEFNFSNAEFWWISAFIFLFAIAALIYGVLLDESKGYMFSGIAFCYLGFSIFSNTYATKKIVIDYALGQLIIYARCSKNNEIILMSDILSAESGVSLGKFSAAWLKIYMNNQTTKSYNFDVAIGAKNFFSIPRETCPHEVVELALAINKFKNR